MRRNVVRALLTLMVLPIFVACPFQQGEDDSEKTNLMLMAFPVKGDCIKSGIKLDLSGTHTDTYGTTHSIFGDNTLIAELGCHWNAGSTENTTYATIEEFDNSGRILYKNVTGCTKDGWCIVGFSRVIWTYSGGKTYFCEVNYGKATLAEAKADGTTADPGDLVSAGCGGWPWSQFK